MDVVQKDTAKSVWIPIRRKYDFHEDIILRIPQFLTIRRRKIWRYKWQNNRDCISKGSKLALNIMNTLKNKRTQNLKSVRTITGLYGLFGLHNCIFDKKYKGTCDVNFGVNGSFDLHAIIRFPSTSESFCKLEKNKHLISLNPCILCT